MLGHDVELGDDLELGAWVVIHSGTVVGDGCEIQDGAVLGKRPRLGARSTAPREPLEPLRLGTGAVGLRGRGRVRRGASSARERSWATSPRCGSAAGSAPAPWSAAAVGVDNDVQIGAGVRVQSNCYLAAHAVIEDDAFVGSGRGDDERRHDGPARAGRAAAGPAHRPGGARRRRGGAAPGDRDRRGGVRRRRRGRDRDVEPRTVVMGVPARPVREVPEADLLG